MSCNQGWTRNETDAGGDSNETKPITSAGSILDISKYRDTCERSISILDGIAILRYIEYRMIKRYLDDISYDPEYRPIRYLNNRRYGQCLSQDLDFFKKRSY